MTNPWLSPDIARQQRELNDRQLAEKPWPAHFSALAEAVRATQCPGEILEVGCGVGTGREILDRAGVSHLGYDGCDISVEAIRIARERYPEDSSIWKACDWSQQPDPHPGPKWDTVIDGCALMHVDDWRAHLAALCRASRRHVILHRVPVSSETTRTETHGYGQTFPAWSFVLRDLHEEMAKHGFAPVSARKADGDSHTWTFAKPRHWVSYCDSAYLPRLKALHASMVRHCGPFELHILSWSQEVATWAYEAGVKFLRVEDFLERHTDLRLGNLPGPPRTKVEHFWSCGPQWIADVMEACGEPVTYADCDVRFFASPEPLFAEVGGAPAGFVGHNFARASQGLPGPTVESHQAAFGALNVGICIFNDARVAQRWADLCRDWCGSQPEIGPDGRVRFGDQKYLEWLRDEFGAVVATNHAAMCGPWNLNSRALDVRDGKVFFGNRQLIAYHFSSLVLGPHGQLQIARPEYRISERQVDILYTDYVREIDAK